MHNIIEKNRDWINETWEKIDRKLSKVALRSRAKLPYTAVNGVHDDKSQDKITWWTNGFWGGMMWLMYAETKNEEYRITAENSEKILDGAFKRYEELHHDVGFMWHLTSGANYRITGNQTSRTRNLIAAATLASRYIIDAEFIRAWNWDAYGYSIIDSLMNIPLLYWASDVIGDKRFTKIAMRHMDMALRDHIRADGSVNHIVDHEIDRVGVKNILAGQGYAADSCWSRGAAWAVYGSILSYVHTEEPRYLEAAKLTANYFIDQCKKTDYKPVIDFLAPPEPVYYDSTAGVCAACGLLELAKYVSKDEGRMYTQEAINLLKACDTYFSDYSEDTDALVLMGSERYPHDEQSFKGVHIPIIYGDFFFIEAMLKLRGNPFLIW